MEKNILFFMNKEIKIKNYDWNKKNFHYESCGTF